VTIVKKYSNRRLYDTEESRYITLDELTQKIRAGEDVRVIDAKSGDDLTQATLTQLILEGPGAGLLPVELLHRLIRMQDDALAEFFSKYVSNALDLYLAARDGAQTMVPYLPFAGPMEAFMRMFAGGREAAPRPEPQPAERPEDRRASQDVEDLRRELEELRQEIRKKT
jgi:polyhydroxyalkanoate synthesis repressor PhaR